MSKTFGYFSIGILLFLFSCSEVKPELSQTISPKTTLIHPLFFQEELSAAYNFPFWFNDSIVSAEKIKTIEWSIYPSELIDTSKENDDEVFQKKTMRYTFNKKGKLVFIQVTNYAEGIIISNQSYEISPKNSSFSSVKPTENYYGVTNNVYLVKPLRWRSKAQSFLNTVSGEKLVFIPNEDNWGPLSIDSIAKPGGEDWVVCGTMNRPVKRYHVRNKVKESGVTTYTYFKGNYPNKITADDFPFSRTRSFIYSKDGVFKQSIDSTFIDGSFVTSIKNNITYNTKGFIQSVQHYKEHNESNSKYESKEIFNYEYYE